MGFRLMDNFNRPLFSASVPEFWRRWHISLMTWFRDYVYIPMGGNRVSKGRWYFNIFFTFTLSGLWHGANWGMVLWGSFNGLYIILSDLTETSSREGIDPDAIKSPSFSSPGAWDCLYLFLILVYPYYLPNKKSLGCLLRHDPFRNGLGRSHRDFMPRSKAYTACSRNMSCLRS